MIRTKTHRLRESRTDRFLRMHATGVAAVVVALGAALRIRSAHGTFLAPDETMVLSIASAPSLGATWDASITSLYPPLAYVLLRGWLVPGHGDLWVRLFPIVFFVAGLLVVWKTARVLAGTARALAALTLLSLSPSLVPWTTEVRPYSLFLFLSAGALEALRRATGPLEGGRDPAALAFGAMAGLAVATHYSAVFLLGGLLPWALARVVSNRLPSGTVARLAAGWSVPIVISGLSLAGHLSRTLSSGVAGDVRRRLYPAGHFRPGEEGLFSFLARQTWHLFVHVASSRLAAALLVAVLVAGLITASRRARPSLLLFLGPLVAGMAVGLLGFYPYGGYRQSTWLLLPLALGVAMSLRWAALRLRAPVAAIALLLGGASLVLAPPQAPSGRPREAQLRSDLDAALASLDPPGSPAGTLLMDQSTSLAFAWYRGNPGEDYFAPDGREVHLTRIGGHVVRWSEEWFYGEESVRKAIDDVRREDPTTPGRLRVFAISPQPGLVRFVETATPGVGAGRLEWFGPDIMSGAVSTEPWSPVEGTPRVGEPRY